MSLSKELDPELWRDLPLEIIIRLIPREMIYKPFNLPERIARMLIRQRDIPELKHFSFPFMELIKEGCHHRYVELFILELKKTNHKCFKTKVGCIKPLLPQRHVHQILKHVNPGFIKGVTFEKYCNEAPLKMINRHFKLAVIRNLVLGISNSSKCLYSSEAAGLLNKYNLRLPQHYLPTWY